jgi:hypothetical protein
MSRKFWLSLTAVSLIAWSALTIACGNSSGSKSTGCNGGPYSVVGDWQITVNRSGGNVSGYGAIDSTGLALFFDTSAVSGGTGDTLQLPIISGSCSFSGNLNAYAEPGSLPPGGTTLVTAPAQGNVTSATALNGSFNSNGTSGTFSATIFSPLTGTAVAVTGSKVGEVQGAINNQPILLPLTFSASGTGESMSFNGTDNLTCTLTGTFTQVGTANVFDVSMNFSNAGSGSCALTGTFTGIGFESSSDYFGINGNKSETYLYADILASSNTFVMEIF